MPGLPAHCWGYPFDWVTRNGVMAAGTPLITTHALCLRSLLVRASDRRHTALAARSCSRSPSTPSTKSRTGSSRRRGDRGYNPHDSRGGVINASAYRAFLLFERRADSSRATTTGGPPSATSTTCCVRSKPTGLGSMRPTACATSSTTSTPVSCSRRWPRSKRWSDHAGCRAIEAGVAYYVRNLFDDGGLPKPFCGRAAADSLPARAIRLRRMHQSGHAVAWPLPCARRNGCRPRWPICSSRWQKPDGSFRSRRLLLGWDNVPMHRWAQAQLFRSLASCSASAAAARRPGGTLRRAPQRHATSTRCRCAALTRALNGPSSCAASAASTTSRTEAGRAGHGAGRWPLDRAPRAGRRGLLLRRARWAWDSAGCRSSTWPAAISR